MTRTEIIEAAGSHYRKMAIAEHQTGHKAIVYYHESDTVEIEDNNNNGQDYRPECTTLLIVGCGSVSCNCDACMAGDDPADWAAGDVAELEAEYDRQVEEAINNAGIA